MIGFSPKKKKVRKKKQKELDCKRVGEHGITASKDGRLWYMQLRTNGYEVEQGRPSCTC
jgi:hypothetical protein